MSTPETMERLGMSAYAAYTKKLHGLKGLEMAPWAKLPWDQMGGWTHAANSVVARVAALGYPRPLGAAEDAREARRCAEWLMHMADGGDAGGEVQTRMFFRTAAAQLASKAASSARVDASGESVKAFREYLSVHEVGGLLTGHEKDALALGLARLALSLREERQ
ncbi:hypothetical protein [Acidovorax sp. ACV01]|uniref:hypothetical protein n=1 Tax=Acidovorax sp. ACV01 TaxID=2769311 RepID=UPI00177B6497|nr:hypothetical protein [Acidovorax sp. ACV01]MBD9395758.1 hypothetical protein [Acidovorax sp. ACV01]